VFFSNIFDVNKEMERMSVDRPRVDLPFEVAAVTTWDAPFLDGEDVFIPA